MRSTRRPSYGEADGTTAWSTIRRDVEPERRVIALDMGAVIADSGDPASVGLHLACGFTQAGRLTGVGFKQGRWVDTVLMQRTLGTEGP